MLSEVRQDEPTTITETKTVGLTSGPGDAIDTVVDDIHVQPVGPASDRYILVATSRSIASEVHDVVATFAVPVLVKRHLRPVTV